MKSEAVRVLVAVHEVEGTRLIGKGAKGEGIASGVVDAGVFGIDGFGLVVHFMVEEGGEAGAVAAAMPESDDHFVDDFAFDVVGGLEAVVKGIGELVEGGVVFGSEKDGLGGVAVAEGVAAGDGLALGGDGASGFGAVAAGGFDLGLRSHSVSVFRVGGG